MNHAAVFVVLHIQTQGPSLLRQILAGNGVFPASHAKDSGKQRARRTMLPHQFLVAPNLILTDKTSVCDGAGQLIDDAPSPSADDSA